MSTQNKKEKPIQNIGKKRKLSSSEIDDKPNEPSAKKARLILEDNVPFEPPPGLIFPSTLLYYLCYKFNI